MSLQRRESGFTYLWLLFAVAGMGLLLAAAAEVWDTMARRERETELLFVGIQYARALAAYHEATPAPGKTYPQRLDELVEDRRFGEPRRHLRRHYRDPMTGGLEWGLLRSDGRIVGVYSLSSRRPLRQHFNGELASLSGARYYTDWIFGPELVRTAGSVQPAAETSATARTPDAAGIEQIPSARSRLEQCGARHFEVMRQCDGLTAGSLARHDCQTAAAARFAACLHGEG